MSVLRLQLSIFSGSSQWWRCIFAEDATTE